MVSNNLQFAVAINRLYPGTKLGPAGTDTRWGAFNGGFKVETHTPESLLEEIKQGHAFCPELRTEKCDREHCGQWCCKKRRDEGDASHCGRPLSYRLSWHFRSCQYLALDIDSGDLTLEVLLADPLIGNFATIIYSTISSTPENPKWRVVFILPEPITDGQVFRKAATALLDRYRNTDQQVKDPARFFYGSAPMTGISVSLGNGLPITEVLKLVSEYEAIRTSLEREARQRDLPQIDPTKLNGKRPDKKYIQRAILEELAFLSTRPPGTGQRYPNIIPTTLKLESLRLSDWLSPEARSQINVEAILLEGCEKNGSLAHYGEGHILKAIQWGLAHAEPRARPPDWLSKPSDEKGITEVEASLAARQQAREESQVWTPRTLLSRDELVIVASLETWPRRYVAYATQRTDAPVEFLEASAYAGLSVVVGRKAQLTLATGPVIPTLWVMLVADSTRYRKSTTIDLIGDVLQRAALDVFAPDDFSPQRLINLMAERSGKATLFRRDEFGGFYEGLNKLEHQAGGKQVLINFHDGHDYRKELVGQKMVDKDTGEITRKAEIIEVKDPFLSILAGTQRDLFLSQAHPGDIYSGFLVRFVYIVPEGLPPRKDVEELDPSIEKGRDSLVAEVRELANAPLRRMRLAQGVLKRWNRYTADLDEEAESAPLPSIACPVFARIGGTAFKVAMRLGFSDGDTVTMAHLLAGIEVAERWRGQTYGLLAAIGPTRDEKIVQRVFDLAQRKPGIKRGVIMSSLRLSAREMDGARETLVQREWLREVKEGKGAAYYPLPVAGSLATLAGLQGASFVNEPPSNGRGQGHADDMGETALGESPGPKQGRSKRSSVASDEASAASTQGDVGEV
jgi:hypothetical protein